MTKKPTLATDLALSFKSVVIYWYNLPTDPKIK